jgi:hypothetical protein
MAKKVESTKAPRKPRTSKPKELSKNNNEEEVTSPVEEILEEDTPEEATPEEIASEIAPKVEEIVEEVTPDETPKLPEDGTELPEGVTPFDFPETPEPQDEPEELPKGHAAYVRKLNPNLEDGKSKWVACVASGSAEHKIYKGSYLKAYTAADNYNVKHGLQKGFVPKLRK